MKKIFIAVGHGGQDPGAVANGLREADCNLVMALAMEQRLAEQGLTVQLSRHTDCNDHSRQEVAACRKFAPHLALVLHNNAGGGHGFEAYCPDKGIYAAPSKRLALLLEQEVIAIGQTSRGIRHNPALRWMKNCCCPTVLCEGFFLDGSDHVLAQTPQQQQQFGHAYARAVLKWFEMQR